MEFNEHNKLMNKINQRHVKQGTDRLMNVIGKIGGGGDEHPASFQ